MVAVESVENEVCRSCKILPNCAGSCAHKFLNPDQTRGETAILPCPSWKYNIKERLVFLAEKSGELGGDEYDLWDIRTDPSELCAVQSSSGGDVDEVTVVGLNNGTHAEVEFMRFIVKPVMTIPERVTDAATMAEFLARLRPACATQACPGEAYGGDACGAKACGSDACGADACAANGCGINVCGADACVANVCAVDIIPLFPFV